MLNANTSRDTNNAARAAVKFLRELGIELPYAKSLDLVARMTGFPQHMAAQAAMNLRDSVPNTAPAVIGAANAMNGALSTEQVQAFVIESLSRVLSHEDLQEHLYKEALSDAAYQALEFAAPFLPVEVLEELPLDALQRAYDNLPCTLKPSEFADSPGLNGLSLEQATYARALVAAILEKSAS